MSFKVLNILLRLSLPLNSTATLFHSGEFNAILVFLELLYPNYSVRLGVWRFGGVLREAPRKEIRVENCVGRCDLLTALVDFRGHRRDLAPGDLTQCVGKGAPQSQ